MNDETILAEVKLHKKGIVDGLIVSSGATPTDEPSGIFMAPKKTITMHDLVAKDGDPRVQDIFNRALKRAYDEQQKTLRAAKKLS